MMSYLKWISLAALVIGAFVVVGVNSDRADSPIVQIEQEVRPLRAVVEAKTAHRKLRRADRPTPSESWDEDALYSDSDANELKKIDIVEQASRSENLSTLLAAIKAAGWTEHLRSAKAVTLFAPTNSAFAAFTGGRVGELLRPENRPLLREILNDHIVPARVEWRDLYGRKLKLKTISGKLLSVDGLRMIRVENARLKTSDILASNGAIHIIDRVIQTSRPKIPGS